MQFVSRQDLTPQFQPFWEAILSGFQGCGDSGWSDFLISMAERSHSQTPAWDFWVHILSSGLTFSIPFTELCTWGFISRIHVEPLALLPQLFIFIQPWMNRREAGGRSAELWPVLSGPPTNLSWAGEQGVVPVGILPSEIKRPGDLFRVTAVTWRRCDPMLVSDIHQNSHGVWSRAWIPPLLHSRLLV